ncbi:hypothetical protein NODU109028_17210 [Nocardioides dubius]|uniref:Uncharacterized protein n=1 Tax=Nocardioides dubius TaxID=317019 RepID=A0ABN1TUA2_9ACTN
MNDRTADSSPNAETAWQRRKRLAEIFGDSAPSSTKDDRDPEESRRSDARASEEWLKRQVPPHHGSM